MQILVWPETCSEPQIATLPFVRSMFFVSFNIEQILKKSRFSFRLVVKDTFGTELPKYNVHWLREVCTRK